MDQHINQYLVPWRKHMSSAWSLFPHILVFTLYLLQDLSMFNTLVMLMITQTGYLERTFLKGRDNKGDCNCMNGCQGPEGRVGTLAL